MMPVMHSKLDKVILTLVVAQFFECVECIGFMLELYTKSTPAKLPLNICDFNKPHKLLTC